VVGTGAGTEMILVWTFDDFRRDCEKKTNLPEALFAAQGEPTCVHQVSEIFPAGGNFEKLLLAGSGHPV